MDINWPVLKGKLMSLIKIKVSADLLSTAIYLDAVPSLN